MKKTRVVVAMSGGVDSSVAAALLVKQGYDVIGIMLRLWADDSAGGGIERANRCCAPEAVADARAIAKQLGIPFYDIHAESVFKKRVVDSWVSGYIDATTPNPCFNCNRGIRFGFLMQKALALGADYLATGHYARVTRDDDRSPSVFMLRKGRDEKKDQSYVLHVLGQKDLARAMFPCGEYVKDEVRKMAREFGLPTAERAESQDLCFLTQGDYRGFLVRHMPQVATPGEIFNTRGEAIGSHDGLPFYTIGQRKGLNLHNVSTHAEPLYVLKLDAKQNALVVGKLDELGKRHARTTLMHYVSGIAPNQPIRCSAKIRYKAKEAAGWLKPLANGGAEFEFDETQRDVTPGQGLVCYDGDVVIGGGVIARETSTI
jgi:tRNA-specific 2-thiouridylase